MLNRLTPMVKRAFEASQETQLPWWSWIVFAVDLLIFLPIIFIVSYTINHLYPVLAIVEDQHPPPAYQTLPLNDGDESEPNASKDPNDPILSGKPITSSLRSISTLLKSNGGFKANFRGFFCLLAQGAAASFLYGIFSAFVPRTLASFATMLATLSLVQLSAAWVHIVITPENPKHFWQRLPPFKKTFNATALAVMLFYIAMEATNLAPWALGRLCGVPLPNATDPESFRNLPDMTPRQRPLAILISLSSVVVYVLLGIPAQVVLVRVQASLLPPEENTIVPFDRSFGGRVEPAVVGGKGYATIKDAWASFGKGAWKRLLVLYVKIIALGVALMALIPAVLVPEILLMRRVAGGN